MSQWLNTLFFAGSGFPLHSPDDLRTRAKYYHSFFLLLLLLSTSALFHQAEDPGTGGVRAAGVCCCSARTVEDPYLLEGEGIVLISS